MSKVVHACINLVECCQFCSSTHSAAVFDSQLTVAMQALASNKLNSISNGEGIFKGGCDRKIKPL